MGKAKKIIAGITVAGAIAGAVPVVPYDENAVLWYQPEKDSKICYQRYADGSEKPFSCDEYWHIANTPGDLAPDRTKFRRIWQPEPAEAAIAFDAVNGGAADAISVSFSLTVGAAGTNRLLVGAAYEDSGVAISTMTYAGVALTSSVDYDNGGVGPLHVVMRYLVAPATGANTFAVTWASGSPDICAMAASYTGVAQTSPVDDNVATAVDNTSPFSTGTLTTTQANGLIVGVSGDSDGTANARAISGTGTERQDALCGSGAGDYGRWMADRIVTTATNYTLAYTNATADGDDAILAGIAFKEDTGGAPPAAGRVKKTIIWYDE